MDEKALKTPWVVNNIQLCWLRIVLRRHLWTHNRTDPKKNEVFRP